jgi:hypothetical protein
MQYHKLERAMARAARDLHGAADALVNELEGSPLLAADTAEGDGARAAYESAHKWRARMESGE